MEKIRVSNFLTLEDIELEIKPINIIIGEQAQGKSVLAKLVYFFKSFWVYYRDSILNNQSEDKFKLKICRHFTEIFPKYTWQEEVFVIEYSLKGYNLVLERQSLSQDDNQIQFSYSEALSHTRQAIQEVLDSDNKKHNNQVTEKIQFTSDNKFTQNQHYLQSIADLKNYLFDVSFIDDCISTLVFESKDIQEETGSYIPASRTFFSSVESNIFSMLSRDLNIDKFIKEFGSLYESFKKKYLQIFVEQNSLENEKIRKLTSQIVGGNYARENGQDIIEFTHDNKTKKINLVNASSGQQESLPILIILSALSVVEQRFFLVIEEPEAHLFPEAQKDMVALMSLIFNLTKKRNKLFITTHSPYFLSSFNSHLEAGNVFKAIKNKPSEEVTNFQERLFEIMPQNRIIDIEDIGVYSLKNGNLANIIDPETNLIDADMIDGVSEKIAEEFDELLDLESEVCQWH